MMQTLLLAGATPFLRGAKLRTCLAMLAGDVVALCLPPLSLPNGTWVLGAYTLLDVAAAYYITRKPAGQMQQMIASIFAVMVLIRTGFCIKLMVSTALPNPMLYWSTTFYAGWVQVSLLYAWGLNDGLIQRLLDRYWPSRVALHSTSAAR